MSEENPHRRLSDFIFQALKIAVEQKDLDIAEQLTRALEKSMTRMAGGPDFAERREFTKDVESTLNDLQALRESQQT